MGSGGELGVPGGVWWKPGVSGEVWRELQVPGEVWRELQVPGEVWFLARNQVFRQRL